LLAVSLAGPALGDGGFYLPPAPNGPGGEDSIETSSGTRCRQSINSNGAYLDVGMAGSHSSGSANDPYRVGSSVRDSGNEALGYARMVMPIGKKPQRIDCTRIYEMELARMRREIELLKMAAE
jgi:hypothetical protein